MKKNYMKLYVWRKKHFFLLQLAPPPGPAPQANISILKYPQKI